MSKQEGSSELWTEEACGSFVEPYFKEQNHCSLCGWEKMDHAPLTELQVITRWATGGSYVSPKEAKVYAQTLLSVIGQIKGKTKEWHEEFAQVHPFSTDSSSNRIDAVDDAAHEIDLIIQETAESLVAGTGGAWGLSTDEAPIRAWPSRAAAVASAKRLRLEGYHVDIYAEIYTDGVHSWELQPL